MEARKVLLAVLLCVDVVLAQNGQLKLSISTDGPYNISVGESEWFRSGPVKVRSQSAWLSTTDGSLILNGTYEYSASDYFGPYDCIHFEYHDKSGDFHFTTFIKTYTTVNALVFGHRFVSGAERTQLPSPDDVISSFPSIQVEDMSLQRGYLTYSGNSKFPAASVAPPTVNAACALLCVHCPCMQDSYNFNVICLICD